MTIYDQIIEACQPYWTVRDNDIHIPASYQFAQRLVELYPEADPLIVLPAILMHDNGYANVPPETLYAGLTDSPVGFDADITRLHEIEGAKIAREILTKLEFDATKIDTICEIIDGHDSRKEALSLEDKLVKDSDKLWRFTAVAARVAGQGWMGKEPLEFIDYCLTKVDGWMFLDESVVMARESADVARRELEPFSIFNFVFSIFNRQKRAN